MWPGLVPRSVTRPSGSADEDSCHLGEEPAGSALGGDLVEPGVEHVADLPERWGIPRIERDPVGAAAATAELSGGCRSPRDSAGSLAHRTRAERPVQPEQARQPGGLEMRLPLGVPGRGERGWCRRGRDDEARTLPGGLQARWPFERTKLGIAGSSPAIPVARPTLRNIHARVDHLASRRDGAASGPVRVKPGSGGGCHEAWSIVLTHGRRLRPQAP